MIPYVPGNFRKTYDEQDGSSIWQLISAPDNLVRMQTATYLGRPAVEPLSPGLVERFGSLVSENRVKQMIGDMAKHAMDQMGYAVSQQRVRINRPGNIFSTATRYRPR